MSAVVQPLPPLSGLGSHQHPPGAHKHSFHKQVLMPQSCRTARVIPRPLSQGEKEQHCTYRQEQVPHAANPHTPYSAADRPHSQTPATLSTHSCSSGRSRGPGQRALQSLLPQGFVLGEVPSQLHQGVGAPALRLHQLSHGHGARQGGRLSAKPQQACTWPRGRRDTE